MTRPGVARRVPLWRNPLTTAWLLLRRELLRRELRLMREHAWKLERMGRAAPRYARVYHQNADALRDELRDLEEQL